MLKDWSIIAICAFLFWDAIHRDGNSFLLAVINAFISMCRYYL